MTFASPAALWLLVLAVPIVAVHFFRGRVRRVLVPTLLFWDQLVVEEERKSALQRLRKLLALLLSLLALAAMTSAFAGPSVKGVTLEPRRVVLVVDTREPMRAGSRLDDARRKARELLSRLSRVDEAALFDAGGMVEAPANRDRVVDALGRLPRDTAPLSWSDVLAAAGRLGGTLYVFSTEGNVPVGAPMANVSVTSPEISTPPGATTRTVSARVTNHSDEAATAALTIRSRGDEIERRTVALTPRESKVVAWELDAKRTEAGALIEIAHEPDAYPDDVATVVIPPTAPVTVSVAGEAAPHLAADLDVLARMGVIRLVAGGGAVVVCDGVEPPGGDGGYLVFRSKGEFEVESPQIRDFSREAPFHRHVDYGGVQIKRSQVLEGRPLVLSDKGAIATWEQRMGRACIRFGFSVSQDVSNLGMQLAFPLLLRGAIEWLAGEGRRGFAPSARTGTIVNTSPLPIAKGEATVTQVIGKTGLVRVLPVDDGILRIQIAEPSLVHIEAAGRDEWIAVNRADDGVDLSRVATGAGPEFPAPVPWWRDLPWAPVAALIAALLLFLEWLLI